MTSTTGRIGDYNTGKSKLTGEQSSTLNMPSLGPFNNGGAWNNGNSIWGSSTAIGSGMKNGDMSRPQSKPFASGDNDLRGSDLDTLTDSRAITGSSSLLPSSESDGWGGRRHSAQWGASNSTNGLTNSRNGHSSQSPVRSRTGHPTRSNSPFSNNQLPAIGTSASGKAQQSGQLQSLLDPTTRAFDSSRVYNNNLQMQNSGSRQNEDTGRSLNAINFGSIGMNGGNNYSGYASSAASRSGSLPPSRHGNEPAVPQFGDFSQNPFHTSKSDFFSSHRPNASRSSNISSAVPGKVSDQNWSSLNDATVGLGNMNLNRDNSADNVYANGWDQSYPTMSPGTSNATLNGSMNGSMNGTYSNQGFANSQPYKRNGSISYDQDTRMPSLQQYNQNQYRGFADIASQSPGSSENRRGYDSPIYQNQTPPLPDHFRGSSSASSRSNYGQHNYNHAVLERKLKSLQDAQQFPQVSPSMNPAMAYRPNAQNFYPQYSGNMTPQALARMNINNQYLPQSMHTMNSYQLNALQQGQRHPPRGPAVEEAAGASLRSALMEEFRTMKGTRKYELKDIYNHVVEFSGDQHGSRFIQQKLESANSDEKAQIFSEIFPNAWQLMTDVFGNYVVQKFFEHGNQTQKKQLADKMKGHVAELSIQMYGCRVVQKAFEHILVDQQASLVKELEPEILKTIKDQNGNHVVQKAIQRIPLEHIAFINKVVSGQVAQLAGHAYGCRVIQRMLESFVGQQAQYEVIDELHNHALNLIMDQYGNYVIQNVIDHGRPEDREKLIELTITNVLQYSKHKYASNVVEHCLRAGTEEHQKRIVTIVRGTDEKNEPTINSLVRDQYGNYVIQTIIKILVGDELRQFLSEVRVAVNKVRQFSYGKHIGQIEKVVEEQMQILSVQQPHQQQSTETSTTSATPPLVEDNHSMQSSSQPSTTNNSTVEGPVGASAESEKSLAAPIEVTEEASLQAK